MQGNSARSRFFDRQVHMQEWKDQMSGTNEEKAIRVLEGMEYKLGEDFVRQHPIGGRFVLDFAFVKEQVALEIDGETHERKIQRKKDDKRDRYLFLHNWICIRIPDHCFFGKSASFYKSLIRETVEERKRQWEIGQLYPIPLPDFDDPEY